MSQKHIVTVNRGDTDWEIEIGWDGSYYFHTHLDPEEWPDPYINAAQRDGKSVPVNSVPDDVEKEALDAAFEPTVADFDDDERDEAAAVERAVDRLLEG